MTRRLSIVIFALVIGLAAVLAGRWESPIASAQTATASPAQTGQKPGMQMGMQDMMKMHEKMMADMKAEQATLDDLVKKMSAAKGDARVDVMASLLTELVRNHQAMTERMDTMHQHMMKMGK